MKAKYIGNPIKYIECGKVYDIEISDIHKKWKSRTVKVNNEKNTELVYTSTISLEKAWEIIE